MILAEAHEHRARRLHEDAERAEREGRLDEANNKRAKASDALRSAAHLRRRAAHPGMEQPSAIRRRRTYCHRHDHPQLEPIAANAPPADTGTPQAS
jgi:hypothetical protein